METQGNDTVITQRDKDAQWARDYYYRNRDAVLARMKARRDTIRAQDVESGIARPGRGRPRSRVEVPKKNKTQEDPDPQGAVA